MARKLVLKTTKLTMVNSGQQQKFDYGEMMRTVLFYTAPPRGLVLAEIEAALDAFNPIKAAMAAGANSVTLTELQWQLLHTKTETFPWGLVDPAIVEFGLMIRDAPEIT